MSRINFMFFSSTNLFQVGPRVPTEPDTPMTDADCLPFPE